MVEKVYESQPGLFLGCLAADLLEAAFWTWAGNLGQLKVLQSCCAHAIFLGVLARSFKLGRNSDSRACDGTKSCSSSGSKGARSYEGLAVLATSCF